MSRIPLFVFVVLTTSPVATAAPLQTSRSVIDAYRHCQSRTLAQGERQRPQLQRLADLPPANSYAAVLRIRNGCPDPLITSTGIGKIARPR